MYEQVLEFHKAFGLYIGSKPELRDKNISKLRINLLTEEVNEYIEAVDNNDLIEIADAIGDILYIAIGSAISYGIPIDEVFDEIHRSNMSKLDENGKPMHREDGKVIKSSLYSPPSLEPIIFGSSSNNVV
jgi:predicted HAD superfamily Cof-like phosphohydrolase